MPAPRRAACCRAWRSPGWRRHRLQRQGDHRQAGLPPRRRCGHADHVPHAVRDAAVRCWRGGPAAASRRWRAATGCGVLGLGFSGYYLASFLDFAGLPYITAALERLILYLNPTLVLLLGWVLYRPPCHAPAAARAWRSATPAWCWCSATSCRWPGRDVVLGALLVFGSALSYARLPGLQRRAGAAPRLAAPDRAGHQRGLRAVHRAVRCCCGRSRGLRGGAAGDLAVGAQRHAVHRRAGADGDDGDRAHRRRR